MKNSPIHEWFSNLQVMLEAEIKQSSALKHPSDTGEDREEIVKRTLRRFLPETVSVGAGKVIDSLGNQSKSVDIVIYDPRYPVFHMEKKSIFPIEAVLAAIEVKSKLYRNELTDALENCSSVMKLCPSFLKEDADRIIAAIANDGRDRSDASDFIERLLLPRTYILGFDGFKNKNNLADSLGDYCQKNGVRVVSNEPLIPSVISTPTCATLSWGDPVKIHPENMDPETIPEGMILCSGIDTVSGFSILASHLMWHIDNKISLVEPRGPIRKSTSAYFPFEELINSAINGKEYLMKVWKSPDSVMY